MEPEFVNLTPENLADEHLSCIIRVKKPHPGVEAKRRWLADRLREGHVFRKLQVKDPVFIEYAPLETAWVPIVGDNFLYVYCLWVLGASKGKGYGRALMEHCLADARERGKSGVCMLGSKKQKSWLSDQSFAKKFGFEAVDATDDGYELLALSFDGTVPAFAPRAKAQRIEHDELTIYYDFQCPYVPGHIAAVQRYCEENDVPLTLIQVDSLQTAKDLPCVFNNWAVFYKGTFETVNLLDTAYLKRILKK
ncbi:MULTISPECIES: GNAT family N-acetyltransferase [Gordonibacter]|uniref:GNAT family N-acetyltransferase n=1 Tax=Gordonibacter TaxID=644652 RepID=UPI001DF6FF2A|nr:MULTISPECIES: GNAT family N-acetyltransferase [Gordonibacter]MDN4508916.1 GNAT family N-acetyltransferase [Gordonibacter sp. RACS_AR49]HJF63818.1 GNAT family N-acetyltransferase [Gordonibacter urolithinfaciens]